MLVTRPAHARPPTTIFSFSSTPAITLDTDGDSLADNWESRHGLDPLNAADASLDFDGDGLDARGEYAVGGDPWCLDSNRDGLPDGIPASSTASQPPADADQDGLPDAWEFHWLGRTDLAAGADTDGDGCTLLMEWQHGLDPLAADLPDDLNQTHLSVQRPTL
ncbi:MAG: hypothetical protein K8T26_17810 [Lentisphaerae bacterium]|nr:hypothetical protein [Lentisphaerota bacterium]